MHALRLHATRWWLAAFGSAVVAHGWLWTHWPTCGSGGSGSYGRVDKLLVYGGAVAALLAMLNAVVVDARRARRPLLLALPATVVVLAGGFAVLVAVTRSGSACGIGA